MHFRIKGKRDKFRFVPVHVTAQRLIGEYRSSRKQTEEIREAAIPLTRDFKETIRERVQRDPKFRKELLREGLEAMLSGEITLAKTILRDYINATVGFTGLAGATHIPPKSLMRMFGPAGRLGARGGCRTSLRWTGRAYQGACEINSGTERNEKRINWPSGGRLYQLRIIGFMSTLAADRAGAAQVLTMRRGRVFFSGIYPL
jgi:hypothetical protein